MRTIITIILLTFTTMVYSQETTVTQHIDDAVTAIDTSGLYRTIYNDVKSGLQGLADGLKVGAEHAYVILVKQQVVRSVIWLLTLLMSLIFLYLAFYAWKQMSDDISDTQEGRYIAMLFVFGIMSMLMLAPALINLDIIVTGLINPEYGAIKEILDIIK